MNPIKYNFKVIMTFLTLALLSACGSKGNLYHSEEQPNQAEQTSTQPSEPLKSDKNEQ